MARRAAVRLAAPAAFCNCVAQSAIEDYLVEIKKAIITAAGKAQRTLPLQTLVDRDGHTKTALRILVEEVLAAGIEEICVVVCPGDQAAYAAAAAGPGARLEF